MPINWILGHKPYQYGHKLIELPETIGVLIHPRLLHISNTEINYYQIQSLRGCLALLFKQQFSVFKQQ